ncbi:MAG: hypothetical protein KAT15_01810 [Bacteroidales bacterium]|nr:hypothetical protein [Bacteroidales bacterium]
MKKSNEGAKVWYFADGYLPEKTAEGSMEAHEALMLLNVNEGPAHVKVDFYFEDRDPVKDIPVEIGPERVVCLHLDQPDDLDGFEMPPLTQYSIRVRSDIPIIVQFGGLDTTQTNMAYYVNVGYCSDS